MQPTADAQAPRPSGVLRTRYGPSVWPRLALTRADRLLNIAVVTIAVSGALGGVFITWFHLVQDPLADVHAYYDAAVRLNTGQPLYPPSADPTAASYYRYPPLLAIVLRPLAGLGWEAFAAVWEGVITASALLLVYRLAANRWTVLALGILAMPFGWCIAIGQAQVPLTLLMAVGTPRAIALAANLKLFPALIALLWIGRTDRRSFGAFVAWTGALILIQVILEPAGTAAYLPSLSLDELGDVLNVSPFALSPWLWAVLVALGCLLAVRYAKTRWGWPVAVALSVLATPRLLTHLLMGLIAALRPPSFPESPDELGERRVRLISG